MEKDKEIVLYDKEFINNVKSIEKFTKDKKLELRERDSHVNLLVSRMIDFSRYPDFKSMNVAEQFNEIMSKFDDFNDEDKRLVVYLLLNYLNSMFLENSEFES